MTPDANEFNTAKVLKQAVPDSRSRHVKDEVTNDATNDATTEDEVAFLSEIIDEIAENWEVVNKFVPDLLDDWTQTVCEDEWYLSDEELQREELAKIDEFNDAMGMIETLLKRARA